MQLQERIILNSEMADLNSNFNSKKVFGIGAAENVTCITQWESQSDFYTGIRTRFARTAKTYSAYNTFHAKMLLVPNCFFF